MRLLTKNIEIEEAKNRQEIFCRDNIVAWLKGWDQSRENCNSYCESSNQTNSFNPNCLKNWPIGFGYFLNRAWWWQQWLNSLLGIETGKMFIYLIFICIYGIVVDIFIKVVVLADFLFRVTKTIKIDITCKSNENDHTCSYEKW